MREHDEIYLDEKSFRTKESFKLAFEHIRRLAPVHGALLDVGSSNGSFLKFIASQDETLDLFGLEVRRDLVDLSRKRCGEMATIRVGSVLNRSVFPPDSFDVVSALGVISIFDDLSPVLENCRRWLKPKGHLVVHGMFNPWDLDVWIKYRRSESSGPTQTGWNIISRTTFKHLCLLHGFSEVVFTDFIPALSIKADKADPIRTWTEASSTHGGPEFFNGLCIRQPQAIAVVS